MNRTEYFAKQKALSKTAARAEAESVRRIRAITRELVIPLVRQYAEQGMISFPKEELARQIDHIIREEGSKPVMAARKLQEDMEASLVEKLGIIVKQRTEPEVNAKQRRLNAKRKPIGEIIKLPGRGWGYGASSKGLASYYRDPQTGKVIWTDLPLEYQFAKRADLSTQVWKAVEEQEQMVFDVIQGGRAAGRNVKQICGDMEQYINKPDGGKIVVGRWMGMFPNTEAGRKEAWQREYLAAHGGLQPGSDGAKALLRQQDAKDWVQQQMDLKTKRGTPKLPEAVKQYATRLGKAGLDYRTIRIARTETTAMLADEQTAIAENSDISSGLMDFVMDRGRDHWNCFDKSAKVLTIKGWKKINKIRVGEYVITASGNLRKVISVMSFQNKSPLIQFDNILFTQDQKILSSNGFNTFDQCNDVLNIDIKPVLRQISEMDMKQFPSERNYKIPLCIIHATNFGSTMSSLYIDLNGNFKLWECNVDIELINSIIKNGGIAELDQFLINSGFVLRACLPLQTNRSFAKSVMFCWSTCKILFGDNMCFSDISDFSMSVSSHLPFFTIRNRITILFNNLFNNIARYIQYFRNSIDAITVFIKKLKNFILIFIALYSITTYRSKTVTQQYSAYSGIVNAIISRNLIGRFFVIGKPIDNISNHFFTEIHKSIITTITKNVNKKYGIKTVFDLEVEDEHNFIVKGKSGVYIFHNCSCEHYAEQNPWRVDDPERPEIPVHPNCMCQWVPRLKTDDEIIKAFKEEMDDDEMKIMPFVEAKSIKEANEYAEKVLGITKAEYKGCDIKVANEMNKSVYETINNFPELKDSFQFVGTIQQRNSYLKETLTEAMYPEIKAMYPSLNEAEFQKKLDMHVKGRIKNLHLEIGKRDYAQSIHNVQSFHKDISPRIINGITVNSSYGKDITTWLKKLENDVLNKYHPIGCNSIKFVFDHELGHQIDDLLKISENKEIMDLFYSLSNDKITEGLSEYAWKNDNTNHINEFIAEAWGEYCNNPNPREIARKIGEFIKMRYKTWK